MVYPVLDLSRFLYSNVLMFRRTAVPRGKTNDEKALLNSVGSSSMDKAGNKDQAEDKLDDGDKPVGNADQAAQKQAIDPKEPALPEIDPPTTNQAFKLNPKLFQIARKSPKDTPDSWITYNMFQRIEEDGAVNGVRVHYCATESRMDYLLKKHFSQEPVLGFDMEWHSHARSTDVPQRNVSLIQIAAPGRIGLFHVALFHRQMGEKAVEFKRSALADIMGDEKITKTGVNILGDATRLRKHFGIESRGLIELSHVHKVVRYASDESQDLSRVPVRMDTLVQQHFHLPLSKNSDVRTSNWMRPLNGAQIAYSATDAYISLQLFYVLDYKRTQLKPSPLLPLHSELRLPIEVMYPPGAIFEESDEEDEDSATVGSTSPCEGVEISSSGWA